MRTPALDETVTITCIRCKQAKPLVDFPPDKRAPLGRQTACKKCVNDRKATRYHNDPEYRQKQIDRANTRLNPKIKTAKWRRARERYATDPVFHEAESKRCRERHSRRLKTDLSFRLRATLRKRLWSALKNNKTGRRKGGSAVRSLGCSIPELMIHLEARFYNNPETGEPMTWSNWTYRGWHIDHIRPLAMFDLTNPTEVAVACHYTNLQPLWAEQNLSKSRKIVRNEDS